VAAVRIEAHEVSVRLGKHTAVGGVTVALRAPEMVAVVGPNGSGKSTLLRALAGVAKPSSGRVLFDGTEARRVRPRSRARMVGLLTQTADTPGFTTVREHVGLGRHAGRRWHAAWTHDDTDAVAGAMALAEVTHLAHRRMEALSGGERQRVRLATMLAQDPRALLLDEPTTGLDIEHQLGLMDTLRMLSSEHGKAVACVVHDLSLVPRYFDRVVVMQDGLAAGDGTPDKIFTERCMREVFGVHGRVATDDDGHATVLVSRLRIHESTQERGQAAIEKGNGPTMNNSTNDRIEEAKGNHPPQHAPIPAATGFALKLKEGTQDLHDAAESGDFQRRMVDGGLVRAEFVAFLQQVRNIHEAIEPVMRDAAAREPRYAEMLEEGHFRLSKIEQDLRDLDAEVHAAPIGATERFIDSVCSLARQQPLSMVGVLYVKEGATNGNKIVAHRIRKALDLDESVALGYLDPHGDEQRPRWMRFKGKLDALELNDAEQEACLAAARSVFQLFIDLSAELAGRETAPASA
jgi:iron complex transport system ATP-binding protein